MQHSDLKSFEWHGVVTKDQSLLIDELAKNLPQLSKNQLKTALKFGAVWLSRNNKSRRVRKNKLTLNQGDELHCYFDPDILFTLPPEAKLVADLKHYSVWNKPSGMFSQPSKWADHTAICRWVELFGLTDRQAFLVHRLDRATSGLIMVAHTKKALKLLTQSFEQRQIDKEYSARVAGKFPYAQLSIDMPINNKHALSHIVSNNYCAKSDTSLLRIKIETGRKHQIRCHLASIGFPVIGDRLYSENKHTQNLQLTACRLSFKCPITQKQQQFDLKEDFNVEL